MNIFYICTCQIFNNVKFKTKKKEVKNFIENLTIRQYDDFRRKVLVSCSVTRATYSNWKNGKTVPKHYHEKINAIAEELTGTKIF